MGLGPIMAIYQAALIATWKIAASSRRPTQGLGIPRRRRIRRTRIARRDHARIAREARQPDLRVNCNLQRLDGPVRGNGQIIQELEASSAAPAGLVKCIWAGSSLPLGSVQSSYFGRWTSRTSRSPPSPVRDTTPPAACTVSALSSRLASRSSRAAPRRRGTLPGLRGAARARARRSGRRRNAPARPRRGRGASERAPRRRRRPGARR